MHIVYVGNKPIILTSEIKKETNFKSFLLKTVKIEEVIQLLNTTSLEAVHLIHKNPKKLLKLFCDLLPCVVAGGGKVYNEKQELLYIFRDGKWDLPKGKTEKNESIETTAIREVEEETGVANLEITKTLPITYHIFKRNGNYKIKITHWFEMTTNYDGKLVPQENEGITKVAWLDQKASEEALTNSYANIRLLV